MPVTINYFTSYTVRTYLELNDVISVDRDVNRDGQTVVCVRHEHEGGALRETSGSGHRLG